MRKNGLIKVKEVIESRLKTADSIRITNKELGELCGISGQVAGSHMRKLINEGVIIQLSQSIYAPMTIERQTDSDKFSPKTRPSANQSSKELPTEVMPILLEIMRLLQQLIFILTATNSEVHSKNEHSEPSIEPSISQNEPSIERYEPSIEPSIRQNEPSIERSEHSIERSNLQFLNVRASRDQRNIYIINKKEEKEKEKEKEPTKGIFYSFGLKVGNGILQDGFPISTDEIDKYIDWNNATIHRIIDHVRSLFDTQSMNWSINLTKRIVFGIAYAMNGFDERTLKEKSQQARKQSNLHDQFERAKDNNLNLSHKQNPYNAEQWKIIAKHVKYWLQEFGVEWTSAASNFKEEIIARGNKSREKFLTNKILPKLLDDDNPPPKPQPAPEITTTIKNITKSLVIQ
jgi:hypothetical protein